MARRTTFAPKAAGRNFCPRPAAPRRTGSLAVAVDNSSLNDSVIAAAATNEKHAAGRHDRSVQLGEEVEQFQMSTTTLTELKPAIADVSALYPLRFEPIFQYRLWGGRRLAHVLAAPLP